MWKYVVGGDGIDSLNSLPDYESQLAEGQRGKLSLNLLTPVPSAVVEQLQYKIVEIGVLDGEISASGNTLDITFRKGAPWLLIIAGIVLGLIALALLVVSWQFYKEVTENEKSQNNSHCFLSVCPSLRVLWRFRKRSKTNNRCMADTHGRKSGCHY